MQVDVVLPNTWISEKTGKAGGNTQGYASAARSTEAALKSVGVEVVTGAKLVINYTSPHFFEPEEGKINMLFTMWEAEDLPDDMAEGIALADYVIVPSVSSKNILKKAGLPNTIYVCHQGIDTDYWAYKKRNLSGKIRFLWVGAPNIRKGHDLAVKAFYKAFFNTDADVELYIKASFFMREGEITPMLKYKALVDTRNLSLDGLRDLYYSSHIFFFPSRGEGVGLPPLEAMSTGIPVIAPNYSGMKDYMFPKHSYPVGYKLSQAHYGMDTRLCEPHMHELVNMLQHVFAHMPEAMEKGRRASHFVRECFTLETMGFRLKQILEKIQRREKL